MRCAFLLLVLATVSWAAVCRHDGECDKRLKRDIFKKRTDDFVDDEPILKRQGRQVEQDSELIRNLKRPGWCQYDSDCGFDWKCIKKRCHYMPPKGK
ncbi:unnamed protein product, partial [Mesorhabditis spiculigera]